MRLQTWKPQKSKEKLIGNHKETQKTLRISGLFHFTRLVENIYVETTIAHLSQAVFSFSFIGVTE